MMTSCSRPIRIYPYQFLLVSATLLLGLHQDDYGPRVQIHQAFAGLHHNMGSFLKERQRQVCPFWGHILFVLFVCMRSIIPAMQGGALDRRFRKIGSSGWWSDPRQRVGDRHNNGTPNQTGQLTFPLNVIYLE